MDSFVISGDMIMVTSPVGGAIMLIPPVAMIPLTGSNSTVKINGRPVITLADIAKASIEVAFTVPSAGATIPGTLRLAVIVGSQSTNTLSGKQPAMTYKDWKVSVMPLAPAQIPGTPVVPLTIACPPVKGTIIPQNPTVKTQSSG